MNKILIADDSVLGRKMIKVALKRSVLADAEIVEATNGQDALLAVEAGAVDLVFIDLYMPVMNGLEFIRRVRGAGCHVPIVTITAETSPALVDELRQAGATIIVGKPIEVAALLRSIEEIVAQA